MRAWLARWLDLRPEEIRSVGLSFGGAFLVIAFLILGRSLREAFYLTSFPIETLPYITAAVAFLSVPTVALFARRLARGGPRVTGLPGVPGLRDNRPASGDRHHWGFRLGPIRAVKGGTKIGGQIGCHHFVWDVRS